MEPVSEEQIEAWLKEVKQRIVAKLQRQGYGHLKVADIHLRRDQPRGE